MVGDAVVAAPASLGQRMLWALGHYRGDQAVLNCPVLCLVRGSVPPGLMASAVDRLVTRHETLRTTYTGAGPRLTQLVHPPAPLPVREIDLSAGDALRDEFAVECTRPLDPTVWPARATLWRVAPDEHVFCLNVHHLATDTTSAAVLFAELAGLLAHDSPARDDVTGGWTYRQFAAWQQDRFRTGAMAATVGYWSEQLAGVRFPELPGPDAATAADPPRVTGRMEAGVVEALRAVAREQDTTLFSVMLALYYLVLHGVAGQRDLAVASIFANRTRPETARTIGFFANMIVLRARVPRTGTFADLVRSVHPTVTGALRHQEVPFHLVPRPAARPGQARADEVVFQMINDRVYSTPAGALDIEALVPEGVGSRFGLELGLVPVGDDYQVVLLSPPGRFPPGFTRSLLARYIGMATQVATTPGAPLNSLVG